MKVSTLLFLVLAFALPMLGQQTVFDDDFESGDTVAWWAPARVGESGQTTCYDGSGSVIPCAGTGQDGELRPGAAWPAPRFSDNSDGTVTDWLTGLVWLKNANCFGARSWSDALVDANSLASTACGLSDGSVAGDWRLPSINELKSLIDFEYYGPALSDAAGTGQWSEGDAFSSVQNSYYWSSSTQMSFTANAWYLHLYGGGAYGRDKSEGNFVWPVRGGESENFSGWWPARAGKTDQVNCYNEAGTQIGCAATGQDGDLQMGIAWPEPRFVDNGNGTVTDMLSGLIWLQNANCFGTRTWSDALADANTLASTACGLSDGSVAGDWRLPGVNEMRSLTDANHYGPALANAAGTAQWSEGDPFTGVQNYYYWSSTSYFAPFAWYEDLYHGSLHTGNKSFNYYVWPVRGGQ